MSTRRTAVVRTAVVATFAGWAMSGGLVTAAGDQTTRIRFAGGHIVHEFVGQVTNFAATAAAPLGTSIQYGYLTSVRGIENVFSGNPHDETTAELTFFNEATTISLFNDGPLRIFARDGVTTIYLNSVPASFSDPDSFRSGTAVQTSTLHQQAIADTTSGTFTAVFVNTITATTPFQIDNTTFILGRVGQTSRSTITGHLNAPAPPTGFFAGYATASR